MNIVYDFLIMGLLFAGFAVLHTFTASTGVKRWVALRFPKVMPWYRLIFNFLSFVTLYIVYELSPKNGTPIYDLPTPVDLIFAGVQFLAFLGMLWVFKYISGKEFIGIAQPLRARKGNYDALKDLDEVIPLRLDGPYKFSRHPIYLFAIIFLVFRPQMQLDYLFMVIFFTAYFFIGSIYEERKLTEKFGALYTEYQKRTGRIFPGVCKKKS
ncbi:MAG: isoprenylcysteine carboxylmethyltransferase family protein [Ignavibacteriales bacterium]|nr:MAG: isoprenylcysteine carboxylmethyltransferase family protein [Ignavibacteriaceae bacterium]MBW7873300.1 isoprenylcysteine carboxylmethyltransferase family protein [Ignavibacteria bacterium]MCZ2143036.1 isoprenylcysteine carboxylmethyltransferase family protein [Ignavibacteriales bacterium]MBV6444727.1 hypothetical protein [Ignavibacteriaceae bacterium]MBZ0196547.1 isoprenylcysteine carboxylmethyltransferase family protein [Ignavibacteriaceae bacterium]